MREHMGLYRGKRIDNGKWVQGYYMCLGKKYHYILVGKLDITCGYPDLIKHPVDPDTVGECCGGLRDKNVKLIFEGYIVCHSNENPYELPDDVEKGKVYWDMEYCGWRRTSNSAFHHGVIDTYRMSPSCIYEIIGNIYDNPEILKGGADEGTK